MATRYYLDNINFPKIVKTIAQRTIIFLVRTLYKDEADVDLIDTLQKRVLISNISAGADVAIGDAIQYFKNNHAKFPFTAYNIEDTLLEEERKNYGAASGNSTYIPEINKRVTTWPKSLSMPFISFFTRADDYQRARSLIDNINATLTRLTVPIIIGKDETGNEVVKNLPFDIEVEINRGTYPYQFEEYLRINRIWDLVHNVEINYFDLIFEGSGFDNSGSPVTDINAEIYPVETLILRLLEEDENGEFTEIEVINPVDSFPPNVLSTFPINESIDVPVDSQIVIVFDKTINMDSIINTFDIVPLLPAGGDWSFSSDCLTATFTPRLPLDLNTVYEVEFQVSDGCFTMEEPYAFSFTTVTL